MSVDDLRKDLSIRGKNGIGFLMSASVIWSIITVIFLLDLNINTQNIYLFFATGIMFPLALLFSKLINADWKIENNPLANLGLIMNIAQFSYFPLVFWAFANEPSIMIMVFAVITAAHLYPYGWFYDAKAYYFLAPTLSVLVVLFNFVKFPLWSISSAMIVGLLTLISILFYNYKVKRMSEDEQSHQSISI
ncbi:DUF7010 family protein [Piscibacillus salipiscarius]|uniref:DUF7010 family protein n=1 Tax=Piscibacillus salipiscarius TaxID=299480 RepID=A0ABW5Q7S7_9BACI